MDPLIAGLQAIASAAHRIMLGDIDIAVATGVESISLQLDPEFPNLRREDWLSQHLPDIYMPMIALSLSGLFSVTRRIRPCLAKATC